VRAGRPDCEDLIAAAGEQNRLLADMPGEHAAVGNLIECNALREIGPGRFGLLGAHGDLLRMRKAIKSSNVSFGQRNAGAGKMFRRALAGQHRTRPAIGVRIG
jgi:hypothetical protein